MVKTVDRGPNPTGEYTENQLNLQTGHPQESRRTSKTGATAQGARHPGGEFSFLKLRRLSD